MRGKKTSTLTARTADKHVLYQRSVQSADVDVEFLSRRFQKLTGRPLRFFREDFCGTAILSCEFVKLHRDNRALAVDIHGPTLEWGRAHNVSQLDHSQRRRISLRRANVLSVRQPKVDLIAALNFSYCVFKDRAGLLAYLRNARRSLVNGGFLVVDAFGGSRTQLELQERSRVNGFTYIWDQAQFDPITHRILCKIHYEFKDGSGLRNAFVYDWRLWTLPELRELFAEAGFADVHVLWEGTERKTNKGNGVFRRVARGIADPSWIAYVVGRA